MNDTAAAAWTIAELTREGLRRLASAGVGELTDGRLVRVQASPADGSASRMALGLSVLPPRCVTTAHSHEAEELAQVLSGEGEIIIDDETFVVGPGSIVLTPANSRHITVAGPDGHLVIWWVYAPPGSEARWLPDRGADGQ